MIGIVSGSKFGSAVELVRFKNDLAIALLVQGKEEEAEQTACELTKSVQGGELLNNPDIATAFNNYGFILEQRGSFPEAVSQYRTSLAMRETLLGKSHPSTLSVLDNLSRCLVNFGELEGAQQNLKLLIERHVAMSGEQRPVVANIMINLASVLGHQGKLKEAKDTLFSAREMLIPFAGMYEDLRAAIEERLAEFDGDI